MKAQVLRQFARRGTWKAIERWRDLQSLAERVGDAMVPLEVGGSYDDPEVETQYAAFDSYLMVLHAIESGANLTGPAFDGGQGAGGSVQLYLAQHDAAEDAPELLEDLNEADAHAFLAQHGKGELYRRNFWIGPPGNSSPMHCDPFHNLFVQLRGTKGVVLCPAAEAASLSLYPAHHRQKNTSRLDFGSAGVSGDGRDWCPEDAARRVEEAVPALAGKLWAETLAPGDALFLPRGVYHYFHAIGGESTFSVNYWWL